MHDAHAVAQLGRSLGRLTPFVLWWAWEQRRTSFILRSQVSSSCPAVPWLLCMEPAFVDGLLPAWKHGLIRVAVLPICCCPHAVVCLIAAAACC